MLIPKQLLGITKSVPKDSSRWTMNGVLAERLSAERVRLVETDGHQLIMVDYDDRSADFPAGEFDATAKETFKAILPLKMLEEAGKSLPTKASALPILHNVAVNESPNGKLSLATTDLDTTRRFECKPLEGTFPNYAAVLPQADETKVRICFNPKLLASVLQTLASMIDEKAVVTLVLPKTSEQVLEITAHEPGSNAQIRALVMPIREKRANGNQ